MDWIKTVETAIEYIEENITEDLTVGKIAAKVHTSPFYFQKGFERYFSHSSQKTAVL